MPDPTHPTSPHSDPTKADPAKPNPPLPDFPHAGTPEYDMFIKRTSYFMVRNRKGRSVEFEICYDSPEDGEGRQCGVVRIPSPEVSDKYGHYDTWSAQDERELPEVVDQSMLASDAGPTTMSMRAVLDKWGTQANR